MQTAKLFMNGRSQAIRLPKEYRFEGEDVYIKKYEDVVVLIPRNSGWDTMINSLDDFTDDFMNNRDQPQKSENRDIF